MSLISSCTRESVLDELRMQFRVSGKQLILTKFFRDDFDLVFIKAVFLVIIKKTENFLKLIFEAIVFLAQIVYEVFDQDSALLHIDLRFQEDSDTWINLIEAQLFASRLQVG